MSHGNRIRRQLIPPLAGLTAMAALWSCDGQNLFAPDGSIGSSDGFPPAVEIQQPREPAARPIGDSVLITARATDDTGVDSILFSGVAFRGDVNLGTDTIVSRYESKMVRFTGSVRDTTVSRYLLATADSERETSVLFAIAYDTQGNIASDSLQLIIGGPRVQFLTIEENQEIQAGLSLNLQVVAMDPEGVQEVVIEIEGAFANRLRFPVNPPVDSILVDTAVVIPAGITGEITATAEARNGLGVPGQDGPIPLLIVSSQIADAVPPSVQVAPTANARLELDDPITVVVSGADNTQGSGIARAGFTVKAISNLRGDTLTQTQEKTFTPARTGNLSSTFTFVPFNVDSLALPDTLVYEITGWMVDGDGNCAAAVTSETAQSLVCEQAAGGERIAAGWPGFRLNPVHVAGRTVELPAAGRIQDAAVDTIRKTLLLSNQERNRVEIFRLDTETFGSAIGVGSEPWGMTIDRTGNRLLVANSGGTNVSIVDLDQERELEQERFFAPDAVIFDLELKEGDSGFSFIVTPYPQPASPSFSDRPQYIAVDVYGNIIYSTRTTSVGDIGTARKAYLPPGAVRSETKLFVEHGANTVAEDFWALAHIDSIGTGVDTVAVTIDTIAGDTTVFVAAGLTLFDHIPGFPDSVISATANTSAPDPVENAWSTLLGRGSDAYVNAAARWNIPSFGFSDPTFVSASGDGWWVIIGEGGTTPTGRVLLYKAAQLDTTALTTTLRVWDEVINAADVVRGVGLNYDGTLGMARGASAYFFDSQLQLNGRYALPSGGGGSGAALHPLHANQKTLENLAGAYRPDTHLAFVGTADQGIDIIDTYKFTRIGRVAIRDKITGPLRAVLPFAEDNQGLTCATIPVQDASGFNIGSAVQLYENGDFTTPIAPDGATEDTCIVLKLFAVTEAEGVVVVPVRKSDVFKYHPNRSGN